MPLGECVRLYDEGRYTADLRSVLLSPTVPPTPEELRTFVLARLTVPDELGGVPAD
jgi:hypothetical protein